MRRAGSQGNSCFVLIARIVPFPSTWPKGALLASPEPRRVVRREEHRAREKARWHPAPGPGGFKTRPRGAEVRSFSANSIALSPLDLRVYLFVFCYILFIIFTMAEKAEMPADTVSLPPTYAPSEAYTESPPPVSTALLSASKGRNETGSVLK